jgi:hypothetical protein
MTRLEWHAGTEDAYLPIADAALPLWAGSLARVAYKETATLTAMQGRALVGLWVLPLVQHDDATRVERSARTLPYASPYIAATHPQRRREIMMALLKEVQARFCSIELPMSPQFYDVTMSGKLGVFVEWRHTYEIPIATEWRRAYTSKVRNHLNSASKRVTLSAESGATIFDFDRGIVGQSPDQITLRRRFIHYLHANNVSVISLTAISHGRTVGQALCVCHGNTAYLFHSWFDRQGPRGVPSLLIDAMAEIARRKEGCTILDLEGSALETVDYFMSGFGGRVAPYPFLYWCAQPACLRLVTGAAPLG